jgi:hypothetical protein
MPRTHQNPGSTALWLSCAAIGIFVWGLEHWRQGASDKATSAERARFQVLVNCLLGLDGPTLVYSPTESRRRLRALAMDTSLEPSSTWVDRCIPAARDLAVHGAEVDTTHAVGSVPTQLRARARELAVALTRVGAVWQVRAGDPVADMDRIADLLARTATEIDLASNPIPPGGFRGPRAPVVRPRARFTTLRVQGAQPLPLGSPARFLLGAPTPLLSAVDVGRGGARVEVIANDVTPFWRLVPWGLVSVVPEEGAPDGLSPVVLAGLRGQLGRGRIAAPPSNGDPRGLAWDAVPVRGALWLAESVRGNGPVLARLPTNAPGAHTESATAVRLRHTPRAAEGGSNARPIDEEVAVGTDGHAVFAASTEHPEGAWGVRVHVVRARSEARAEVFPVPASPEVWSLRGRRPALAFCTTHDATWLFAAAREEWRAGVIDRASLVEAARVTYAGGPRFDESLTVRCEPYGALVYARERPRQSPMLLCHSNTGSTGRAPSAECESLPRIPSMHPADLPPWVTVDAQGRALAHPEWPLGAVVTRTGTVVAARAAGTIAAVTRWTSGAAAWLPERVVFDAAAREPHATVQGVEVYTDGQRLLLVIATATELHLGVSEDDGATWRPLE